MKIVYIASPLAGDVLSNTEKARVYCRMAYEQSVNPVASHLYSMRGMPHMTPEVILRIFDVPPDKHNDWICNESEMPTVIDYDDCARVETDIEPLKINVEWCGDNYCLFPDVRRIYSFNEEYIKPLLDEPDYLTYHKRETASGGFVLACKIGFELKAIIAPAILHEDKSFTNEIKLIAGLYAAMEHERIINAAYEIYGTPDNPPPLEIDKETGEVLDGQVSFTQETL